MDFRDRIRMVIAETPGLSVREVSLRAGSDSMLSKVLNPDKAGGIKSPGLEKIESIARALRVSPGWLAFGEGLNISDEDLREMAEEAADEIQAGMRIEEIRSTVASALRDQLRLHLIANGHQDTSGEKISPGKGAPPPAPTREDDPEERRTS